MGSAKKRLQQDTLPREENKGKYRRGPRGEEDKKGEEKNRIEVYSFLFEVYRKIKINNSNYLGRIHSFLVLDTLIC